MLVELLDIFLSGADHVKIELEGMDARSWEVGRYADGGRLCNRKVDHLDNDRGEGDAKFNVVGMVEGHIV